MSKLAVIDESFPTKVSAEFEQKESANEVMHSLTEGAGFKRDQVRLIVPDDRQLGRKLEPETQGIARTLARSHLVLGILGLVLGLCAAWWLTTFGPTITQASPLLTYVALAIIFPFLGLLLAGAISLRPDHDLVVAKARKAAGEGRWTVVVHCTDSDEKDRAKRTMEHSAQTL